MRPVEICPKSTFEVDRFGSVFSFLPPNSHWWPLEEFSRVRVAEIKSLLKRGRCRPFWIFKLQVLLPPRWQ